MKCPAVIEMDNSPERCRLHIMHLEFTGLLLHILHLKFRAYAIDAQDNGEKLIQSVKLYIGT